MRAALLTSTLAVPGAKVDIFSDFDLILILSDVQPFFQDRAWLEDFGHVLDAGYALRRLVGVHYQFDANGWEQVIAHHPPS